MNRADSPHTLSSQRERSFRPRGVKKGFRHRKGTEMDATDGWFKGSVSAHNYEDDLGASGHPNYRGQLKVASCIIPYISTMTGWKMEEKIYR